MSEIKLPEIDNFIPDTIQEEIRIDEHCRSLLNQFYQHLLESGCNPKQASELAFSADYYLRNYLVDFARQNEARPQPGVVRRFAASWYITRTLEPDIAVLERHLDGILQFYRFLHKQHLIAADELAFIEEEAGQTEYFKHRIKTFIAVSGDDYISWEAECPLNG